MDEKDHLGETLRLKELGEEERYFGERDREALANIKARHAEEQEHVLRERGRGRCPQCGELLHQRSVHSITILDCLSCQGVWLNKDKLQAVMHPSASEWLETFLRGLGWWRTFKRD